LASQAGTLETVAAQLGQALQPLEVELNQANVLTLFAQLGLQFPPALLQPALKTALSNSAAAATALTPLLSQLATAIQNGNIAGIVQAGANLIQQIQTLISSLDQVGTEVKNLAGSLGMNAAEVSAFATALPGKIVGYMLITYLEQKLPAAVAFANIFGAIDYLPNPGIDGDPTHPPFILRQLQLGRLGDVLKSPLDVVKALYDWGAPGFDGTKLIPRLAPSLTLLGIPATVRSPGPSNTLDTSFFGLTTTPPGVTATLTEEISSGFDFTIPVSPQFSAHVQMQGTFAANLSASFAPPANVTLKPPGGQLNGLLELDLVTNGGPVVLFGQTGGSRIHAETILIGAGVSIHFDTGTNSVAEPHVTVQVTGGKAVIDTTNADGFLQTVLSGVHVEAGFDFKVTWAPDTGVHFEGGAQLEITLPLHLNLGPVTIPTLYLVSGASTSGIPIEISVALGLTLGPFQASVDRVGVAGLITFPDHGGNLGPANLALQFKPPNGLGIAIDAGVVAGGGFIQFDPAKGQYAGILDVELAGIIQVKIIAVLDTILPDGSHGYSLLMIVTFDLPPIQLSFGFTLNGVGGLFGVNRTMAVDALHAGLRAHTLNSILFPADPIANAPAIISNIRSFFPPADGRFIFGPLLELGWGTPTLITLTVGVLLEVPDPVRLAIIGLIDCGLPTEDVALISLHIDVLGTIDFGAKKLAISGSLFDSNVLIYSLSGDLEMRLTWGADPSFLFSLGGFNPHFNTAGLDIPPMNRMSISIGDGDNPRISSNSYFAVTSNTLQFGANTEAYASAAGFSVHGYLGFDVLIIYSPFSFIFDFKAEFDVAFEGHTLAALTVDGTFSGPRPFHLHAHASIDLFFFSVSASLTLEWGDSTPAILPKKPVLPDLVPALEDPRNWSSALPQGATQAVSLVSAKPDDKTLRLHPMGTLTVRETVVPLDQQITRYGNAEPSDGHLFAISAVQVNATPETKQNFQDYFAAAQFLTLSDADKLSRPSFERFDAGVTVGSGTVITGANSPRTVQYEERIIDVNTGFSRFTRFYALPADRQSALTLQGAGFLSAVKNTGLVKYQNGPAAAAITADDPGYVVVGVDDLAVRSDISPGHGASFYAARASLDAHLALHPEEAVNLQIMPLHEVAA
jgi:hypothetical protein